MTDSPPRVDILGCPFDAISFDDTLKTVEEAIRAGRRMQVVPGNVDFVVKARRDPAFAALLWKADLVIADGVPITWAAKMLGRPLRGRVSGTDFVWRCAEISARTGVGMALIGAAPGVADRTAAIMCNAFPGARVFAVPTPFPLGPKENAKLVDNIRARNAKIVLAALGAPRQERWVAENLDACGALIGAGIGSAFDILCGDKPRAPRWMADNGLEWLHRMIKEPKRLGRRYLIEDSPFFYYLLRELTVRRFAR